ncbi:nucleoside recognition domain-containing protein [Candidatus Uabimicrobium amorphum]|uniref:Transporter n=1 Tax=Uabimicrobium amorphum TaxID=2596890 RepID=A0A5S9IQT7_UABAM|nr:nucleoside recognition domain-containing protein [Candidatus Uabimicrobium amorphum]BBM86398.1 transporter [Candidatus Uabimicrobium amorphum]
MKNSVILIGKESVGKSQLIRSLTGKNAISEKVKGTTINIQSYETSQFHFIDTPGILLETDSLTTKLALNEIPNSDCVILVITATSIDKDLSDLLPLVQDKPGAIIITHWDLVKSKIHTEILQKLEQEVGIPIINVDTRNISSDEKQHILDTLTKPQIFKKAKVTTQVEFTLKPKKSIFEVPLVGKLFAILLLLLPAWVAVKFAILLADNLYDTVYNGLNPIIQKINNLPSPISHLLGTDYGIISMFPFLVLYALPTVFLFAIILSLYKTSGLVDRLTLTIHPLVAPFGIVGRDVVRIVMGFGCNVPAVISTRSCSSCTRGNCISAISFGAACSYQLPATIAVFAAAKMDYLIIPYLLILAITTLIYLWVTTPKKARIFSSKLVISERDFMQWPSLNATKAEVFALVKEFFRVAFPIFIVICLIAGVLNWLGVIEALASLMSPVMTLFNLPGEAAASVVLGSIRKDGIAIGLLNPAMDGIKIAISHPVQILTVVYLAGVLLPCIVTLFTVAKEINVKFALKLTLRQMIAAIIFSLFIAWIGYLI